MSLLQGVFPFKPNHLGVALTAWFDADDSRTITESGGLVSQWSDKSGNANHVVQATGSNQPTTGTRTLNGLNVIHFDGTESMKCAAFSTAITGARSVYVVVQQDSTGSRFVLDDSNTSRTTFFSTGGKFSNYNGGTLNTSVDEDVNLHLRELVLDASGNGIAYHEGTQVGSASMATNTQTGLTVGARYSAGAQMDGVIAEIIFCDEEHSDDTRNKVEGYLAWKWGLEASLPAAHPYKSSPPTV